MQQYSPVKPSLVKVNQHPISVYGIAYRRQGHYVIWLEADEIKTFFRRGVTHYVCEMLSLWLHILYLVLYLLFIPNWLFSFLPNATIHLMSPLRNRQIVQIPWRGVCVDVCRPHRKIIMWCFDQNCCTPEWISSSSVTGVSSHHSCTCRAYSRLCTAWELQNTPTDTVENKCSKICRMDPKSLEWGAVTLFCVSWMGGITYRGCRVPPRAVTKTLQYRWTAWLSSPCFDGENNFCSLTGQVI